MKKIQLSTVQMNSNVEVIFVNSNLISKAIRAKLALDTALENTRSAVTKCDENGEPIYDENGKPLVQKDENGNIVYEYSYHGIRDESKIAALHDTVKMFIDELTDAFEA